MKTKKVVVTVEVITKLNLEDLQELVKITLEDAGITVIQTQANVIK